MIDTQATQATSPPDALTIGPEFLRAGRAVFTVENPTGEHYTYRFGRPTDGKMPEGYEFFFVALLTGPDNEHDYSYLGCYYPKSATVRLTGKSQFTDVSRPVRVLRWAVEIIDGRRRLPAGYQIRHAGRCGRCGRVLTTPDSLTSGLGSECRKKINRGG